MTVMPTLPICPRCRLEKEGSFLLDETGDDLICKSCRESVGRGMTTARGTSPTRTPLGSLSRLGNVGRTLRSLANAVNGLGYSSVRPTLRRIR